MKVLVLIDAWYPFVGGAQIQIRNLEKVLKKKFKVEYCILHSPSSNIVIRFLWSLWVIPQVVVLHLKDQFDLIHAHAYWPGIPGKILSLILGVPVIFTVHGSNLLDLKVKSLKAWLEKIILTKIKYDQVISAASNFLKYKNVNKNIVVINNGVDIKEFRIKNLELRIRDRKSKLNVLSVGRDDPVKGWKYLIKAMKRVKKDFPQAQLKIVKKEYSRKTLIKEYLKADVFVLPSLSEGQPLTLLEAWAAKLPVVVTTVGENPRMVKNDINGYLVQPKDSQALAKAIIKVLRDKNRQLMGKRGYQLVKTRFTWDGCAQKTYEIYEKVLSQD